MRHPLAVIAALLLAGCASVPAPTSTGSRVAVDSLYVLAEVALQEGRAEDATRLLLEAAEISADPLLAERAARLAEESGLTEPGLRAVARWSQLAPADDRSTWFRGIFNMRTGRLDAAAADFSAVIDALPAASTGSGLALAFEAIADEADAGAGTYIMNALVESHAGFAEGHYALARLALRSGDFDLCLRHAREAARMEPDWLDAQLLLARALLVGGSTQESLELARKLAAANPEPPVRQQLAELLLWAGERDEAETILNEIVVENPELVDARRALAFLHLARNELDKAREQFEDLRNRESYSNEAFYYLGRIAEGQGNQLRATRSYARVTEGTHVVEAQLRIARMMFEQTGDETAALDHLREFGNENSIFATDMIVARSDILMQLGRTDAAFDLINEALEASPSDTALQFAHVQLFTSMSQAASDTGDLARAEDILNEALDLYPGNVNLRYSLSLLYENQGRNRRAAAQLAELVEDEPDNPALLNAYGYLLTDEFERHAEARDYIARALAMDPDNPAIIDSMGWVLFKQGDYTAALDYLARAYRLYNDPEVIAHLIDTHWALGNLDEARALFETGSAEFPDSRHILEIRQRLFK
ncbi:MAG: tetratricopeptide repeat protein [Gammaproteobacteria bacterium]|jgi:tetratricopeptide (TPR) repeat protein